MQQTPSKHYGKRASKRQEVKVEYRIRYQRREGEEEDMEKEVPKQSKNSSISGTNSTEGKAIIRTSVEATKFHTDCQKEHEASLDCEPMKISGPCILHYTDLFISICATYQSLSSRIVFPLFHMRSVSSTPH